MKLLFLFLAHNEPDHLARLADTLATAASDGHSIIHFDANAKNSDFEKLSSAVEKRPHISLTKVRARCRWGDFSLVAGTLNALRQAREERRDYDYVILLSGACLPIRPVRQLERFLADNNGMEFIEIRDESWILNGLRSERYRLYFPLPPMQYPRMERILIELQRLLGVQRKLPDDLVARFGSQWWALTWRTCERLLDYLESNPQVETSFRRTWIPDEMFFQTLVNRLVEDKSKIADFNLTYFQFNDRGKPIVFYDDHGDYPFRLKKFFIRKVSSEAVKLRDKCLDLAAAEDNGEELQDVGRTNDDYEVKVRAQSFFPMPGQLYYRDQFADMTDTILPTVNGHYILVCGPRSYGTAILEGLHDPQLTPLGFAFKPSEVDFGPGRDHVQGLRRTDAAIRDAHPVLYLARLRQRVAGVPVLAWSPGDERRVVEAAALDPNALIVSVMPLTTDRSQAVLAMLQDLPADVTGVPAVPGISRERAQIARLELMQNGAFPEVLFDWAEKPLPRHMLHVPYPMPGEDHLWPHCRELQQESGRLCHFRYRPWFSHLTDVLSGVVRNQEPADPRIENVHG